MSTEFLEILYNKHILEEILHQFGYLPDLYEDARPEKYKK